MQIEKFFVLTEFWETGLAVLLLIAFITFFGNEATFWDEAIFRRDQFTFRQKLIKAEIHHSIYKMIRKDLFDQFSQHTNLPSPIQRIIVEYDRHFARYPFCDQLGHKFNFEAINFNEFHFLPL